jgi:U4/U6.U5 tri-snRNP component SNU23
MRVERAGVDRVKDKIDSLKRKISDQQHQGDRPSAIEEYESRVAMKKAEEDNRKRKKREDEAARKREAESAEMDAGIDPEIAQLMGFGGFGGSRKS